MNYRTKIISCIKNTYFTNYLLYFICGIIFSLNQAPYHLIITTLLLSMIYFTYLIDSKVEIFIKGTLFGAGYFTSCMHWIAIPLIVNNMFHIIILLPIGFFILGTIYGIPTVIFKLQNNHNPLTFALIFTLSDYLRSMSFINMPWGYVGCTILKSVFLSQIIKIIGIHGTNFIIYFIVAIPAYLYINDVIKLKYKKIILILYTVIILSIIHIALFTNFPKTEFTKYYTRIIQPNQRCKLSDIECMNNTIQESIYLSKLNRTRNIDLIIWPEGSVNKIIREYNKNIFTKQKVITDLIDNYLILGIFKRKQKKTYYDMIIIDKDGYILDMYDKKHPVPFGETLPFFSIYKKIFGINKSITTQIEPGLDEQKYFKTNILKIKPSVCFDIAFNDYVNPESDILINIGNQSWYNNNETVRKQYIDQAKVRAIESGLPVLSSIKNGKSFIIDQYGRLLKELNYEEVGYIESLIPARSKKLTFYSRYGKK